MYYNSVHLSDCPKAGVLVRQKSFSVILFFCDITLLFVAAFLSICPVVGFLGLFLADPVRLRLLRELIALSGDFTFGDDITLLLVTQG